MQRSVVGVWGSSQYLAWLTWGMLAADWIDDSCLKYMHCLPLQGMQPAGMVRPLGGPVMAPGVAGGAGY
jgi:hypothetical protein